MAYTLLKLALAIPMIVGVVPGVNGAQVTAKFDDLPTLVPGTEGKAPPTPYKELAYSGIGVGSASVASVAALRPASLPNFAVSRPLQTQSISSKYVGSKVKSFNLRSLKAGCYAGTEQGVTAPPVNCTITFTGMQTSGKKVTRKLGFGVGSAGGVGLKNMAVKQLIFPPLSFNDLVTVTSAVTEASLPEVGGATVQYAIDDVTYVTNEK